LRRLAIAAAAGWLIALGLAAPAPAQQDRASTAAGRLSLRTPEAQRSLTRGAIAVEPSLLEPGAARRWPTASQKFRQMAEEARLGWRIIGGQPPPEGYFKETVGILSDRGGTNKICTGVIVAPNWVLTAAHCVCDLKLDRAAVGEHWIVFGDNMGSVLDGDTGVSPNLAKVDPSQTRTLDREFCKGRQMFGDFYSRGNDIALLSFELQPDAPVRYVLDRQDLSRDQNVISPARIATPFLVHTPSLDELVVVGFGINDTNTKAGTRMFAGVPIESRICGFEAQQRAYGCAAGLETVLVDPRRGKDTCRGDSGGPAFAVIEEDGQLTYVLVGITSRAVEPSGSCGPGGIYTLLTPQIVDWMRLEGVPIHAYDYPNQ
jgi:secreted trypsin-like serine protease